MNYAYWNGQIIPREKILIPCDDPAFQYGEGVFTTLRIKEGHPQFLQNHLKRLQTQSSTLRLPFPKINPKVIDDLIVLNRAAVGNFRLKLIRSQWQEIALLESYISQEGEPCKLKLNPSIHFSHKSTLKSLAYLERKQAREEAQIEGFDDAIFCCPKGHWLETGSGNLFWYEQGAFFYPDQTNYYLKGIMLAHLIQLKRMVPSDQNPSGKAHLYYCNSLHGVRPIVQIDEMFYNRNFDLEKEWSI